MRLRTSLVRMRAATPPICFIVSPLPRSTHSTGITNCAIMPFRRSIRFCRFAVLRFCRYYRFPHLATYRSDRFYHFANSPAYRSYRLNALQLLQALPFYHFARAPKPALAPYYRHSVLTVLPFYTSALSGFPFYQFVILPVAPLCHFTILPILPVSPLCYFYYFANSRARSKPDSDSATLLYHYRPPNTTRMRPSMPTL